MDLHSEWFELPPAIDREAIEQTITAHHALAAAPWSARREHYLDTFDWRLHGRGATLTAVEEKGGFLLTWRRNDGSDLRSATCTALPAFADDLPAGALRDAVAPVIAMRRLLPIVTLLRSGTALRVLDGRAKTVVRMRIEHWQATVPGVEAAPAEDEGAPTVLRLRSVRGYEPTYDTVHRLLVEKLGLEPMPHRVLARACAAIGRTPGDYQSKLALTLDPEAQAAAAVRTALASLLATVRANEDGVRRDLDSEFLHDFRVAVRRTRSLLGQVKGVLPPAPLAHFRSELSWLGKITGPTRDLDVYLLKMDDYELQLPPAVRRELAPLRAYLVSAQRQAQERLAAHLDEPRYAALLDTWQAFAEGREEGAEAEPENAARPIATVAAARIWRAYRRLSKRGRAIDDDTPDAAVHRLRIDGKKLRYLLEIFSSLYTPEEIGDLIRALKKLQDCLGDFNDYTVQQEALADFARQMAAADAVPADTLLAMGRLVERLAQGQDAERARFAKRFRRFDAKPIRQRFRHLFKAV